MKKRVKRMAKDTMVVGMTGVGLGVMGSVCSDSCYGATAIGKLGTGLGTAGSAMMMGHTLGFLQDTMPKKKKRRY